jgi:hypothetical protein
VSIAPSTVIEELELTELDDETLKHLFILCPVCEMREVNPKRAMCGLKIEVPFTPRGTEAGGRDRCPGCIRYALANYGKEIVYQCSGCLTLKEGLL